MKSIVLRIYLYMLVIFVVINFCLGPFFEVLLKEFNRQHSGRYWQDRVSGFYHVIETDLERLPQADWARALAELESHFAFPLTLRQLADFREEDFEVLSRGEIVVQGVGEGFRHRIGQSAYILEMGPIPGFESRPEYQSRFQMLHLSFYLVAGLLFFGFALIWAWPFARNLDRVSAAATAFGRGELDTRAVIPKRSSFHALAESFNRMADRIQQLIASHRELTHMISHELRTPLARIRFSMEMLASARGRAEREKRHDAIRRDVDELDLLVSELLTYARFDHENFRPAKEPLELGTWLGELAAAWNREPDHLAVDFRVDSSAGAMPIAANPRLLERAVRNLLQNGARHARQCLQLSLTTDADQVAIHVDDDGAGVAEAERRRIFEPFVRLEQAEEGEESGYGLGLAIVRRVADWHGARVQVETAPIGGARFSLYWPRDDAFQTLK